MALLYTGLKSVLYIFDAHGWEGSYKRGFWSIANGGYDLWFQLTYKGIPVADCVSGVLSSKYGLDESEKDKLFNAILKVYDHLHIKDERDQATLEIEGIGCSTVYEEPPYLDMEEEAKTVTPANSLPEGWHWVDYSDGSGSLRSPDGKHYFSYDLHTSYTPMGGIEYEEKNGWTAFYGSLAEFKEFAEMGVAERYLDSQTLDKAIAQANSISEQFDQGSQKQIDSTEIDR